MEFRLFPRSLLLVLGLTSAAAAQPDARRPAPAPAPPAAPTPEAEPQGESSLEPKLPDVDDPMLKPLPAAKSVLRTWQDAVHLARRQSSQLLISNYNVDVAEGQARQTLSRALPTLTGTAGVTQHLLHGEGGYFTGSGFGFGSIPHPDRFEVAQAALRAPLFAPQAWYDYGTAKRARNAAKLSYADTQRLTLAAVADAIVSVVTAERLAEVSRVSLKSTLGTLELNKRRAALGAASSLDVLRAEQEVTLTRSQVVQADENVRKSRENLGLALGSSDPWGVVPSIRVDALASDARAICKPVNDVETRADVRAARANLEIAERNVKSVDWSFVPTVDFVSNLNYNSNRLATGNLRHETWTIGGLVTWNIYDGGLRYGNKAVSEANRRIAEETVTQTKRQARIQAVQSQRAVDVARANLSVAQKTRELAVEGARLARIAFVSGRGNSFDLIDADKRLRSADLDLAVKEFDLIRAEIAALLTLSNCEV